MKNELPVPWERKVGLNLIWLGGILAFLGEAGKMLSSDPFWGFSVFIGLMMLFSGVCFVSYKPKNDK